MTGQPFSLSCPDMFFTIIKAYSCSSYEGGISTLYCKLKIHNFYNLMKMALHGLKRLQRILYWSRADNVAYLTTTLHIELTAGLEPTLPAWNAII